MAFKLAACAETLWPEKPIDWRASRLHEMGFAVGLWNYPDWGVSVQDMAKTGAEFSIMNGYLQGRLADDEGADMLLASAKEVVQVGKELNVARLNIHPTGLGDQGIPIPQMAHVAPGMWLKARDTLHRLCDLAEEEGVTFVLENLNLRDHPGCPFNTTSDVLELVSAVNRPQMLINLDLYHTQIGEGDLIRWCEACLPWIGEIQVADNPGRFEPGTGEVNWAGVAKALDGMGFSGAVGLEAYAKASEEEALEAFRAAFTL